MQQRGRKSAASLGVVGGTESSVVSITPVRPPPPPELTKRAKEIWVNVTNSMPADWFSDADMPLLRAYVAAAAKHESVSERAATAEDVVETPNGALAVNPIFRLQTLLANSMASLATKLKLSQSGRYHAPTAGRKIAAARAGQAQATGTDGGNAPKPWQQ